MKRLVISVVLALALLMVPVSGAFAASTQEVTVTATPSFVSISNTPTSEALGTIADSTTHWANPGGAPTDTLDDAECLFTVTNDGSVTVNIQIKATDFTGGVGWTLASTAGENQVVMKAGFEGETAGEMQVVTTSNAAFISSLASSADIDWEFSLETGTFTDGTEKSSTITLTAAAA